MSDEKMENKVCRACNREKPLSSFNRTGKDGYYTARCKICINNGVLIKKPKKSKSLIDKNPFGMAGVTRETYKEMFLLLQKMGYDLSKPIHDQFCEKYNLPTKKRLEHKKNKFFPESFGLV